MRNKHVTQNDIIFLSGSLFVIVFLWIGSNLYHAWVTSTISPDLQIQIVPISPTFDTDVIDQLKNRTTVLPNLDQEAEASISGTITPTQPIGSTEATPTINPNLTP